MAYLASLAIEHFRNFAGADVHFVPGINTLSGPNAAGKTNLLEAVYYLSLLRSFRTIRATDLIRHGCGQFRLYARFSESEENAERYCGKLEVTYGKGKRAMVRDGIPLGKASEFVNAFVCISFVPSDLRIVTGGGGQRRRYMDIELSRMSATYMYHLRSYNTVLRSRNALLRDAERYGSRSFDAYEKVLAYHGARVSVTRRHHADMLNRGFKQAFSALGGTEHGGIEARYYSSPPESVIGDDVDTVEEELRRHLFERRNADIRRGVTGTGPHRDDIKLLIEGREAAVYGSMGQCRLCALALKLVTVQVRQQIERLKQKPLLMVVDEVFGELDKTRQEAFFSELAKADQVIVAGTEIPEILVPRVAASFRVTNGEISKVL